MGEGTSTRNLKPLIGYLHQIPVNLWHFEFGNTPGKHSG